MFFNLKHAKLPIQEKRRKMAVIIPSLGITMTVGCVLMLAVGLTINFYQMRKTNEFRTKLAKMTGLYTTFFREDLKYFEKFPRARVCII